MSIKSEIHLSLLSMEQEFEEYLKSKRIDPEGFLKNEPETFNEFKNIFPTMHPKSFTMQKLFLINILRRKYHFTSTENIKTTSKPQIKPILSKHDFTEHGIDKKPVSKPVVRPKMSKPLIGQKKTDNDESLKQSKKPVIRPIIKPVTNTTEDTKIEAGVSKPKPKMQRPVIKPKVKPDPEKEENKQEINSNRKKPVKPVIKPKIQKPNKED